MKIKKPDGTPWNNGNLDRLPCALQRRQMERTARLEAPADAVFAALGAMEGWLAAERSELRTSESGGCELHALWSLGGLGQVLFADRAVVTYGYVTRYEPSERSLHLALLNPDQAMGLLRLKLDAGEDADTARLTLELTYSAVSTAGNALLGPGSVARMETWLDTVAAAIEVAAQQGAQASPRPRTGPVPGATRTSVSEQRVLRADADEVFPYACPVAELDWIEDWQFDLLHSVSGRNELHNIFSELTSGVGVLRMMGASTCWYTTRWDPARRRFHALLLTGDLVCAQWEFRLHDLGEGRCRMELTLTYTGLTPAGERILAEPDFANRMRRMLVFVLTSARCYAETGKIYRLPHRQKARIALSVLGATLGRHLRRIRAMHHPQPGA